MAKIQFRKFERASVEPGKSFSSTRLEVVYSTSETSMQVDLDFEETISALRAAGKVYTATDLTSLELSDAYEGKPLAATSENNLTLANELEVLISSFTRQGLEISAAVRDRSDLVLEVVSNVDFAYELPWESISKDIRIHRRITGPGQYQDTNANDNYAFLISHGYLDGHHEKYAKIVDDFESEIMSAISNIFKMRKGYTKPQLLTILRYLNSESIQNLDLGSYSSIHLLMHGRSNGDVGFERHSDHWEIDWITPEKLADLLMPHTYDLVFLSCCYSGYGDLERSSLAQQLVKKRVAKNVIAFNGLIGSDKTLPPFVQNFYERYNIDKNVESSFRGAVDYLHRIGNPYADKPVLYLGEHA